QALAEKVAYYGHALSDLLLARLGVERAEFAPIERAVMVDRDLGRAAGLVTDRMLEIGVWGPRGGLGERVGPLGRAGGRARSLGPDPLHAVELLGRDVLPRFR